MCGICMVTGIDEEERGFSAQEISDRILFKLQHRGQGATGKSTGSIRGMNWSMGHNRYATNGDKQSNENKQPVEINGDSSITFAHNGQFGGFDHEIQEQKQVLKKKGHSFKTSSDSELWAANYNTTKGNIEERVRGAFTKSNGSGAIVANIDDYLVAGRRVGNRPLFMARINGGGKIFSSEDYMLRDIELGGEYLDVESVEEVPAGKFMIIDDGKETIHDIWNGEDKEKFDIFELIYFSYHFSHFKGAQIHEIRKQFGRNLAKQSVPDVDVISSVPNSGNSAAAGYAEVSGLPCEEIIDRDNYSGRSFIWGTPGKRNKSISLKYNLNWDLVKRNKILLVDDSIVRGNTLGSLVEKLKRAGAAEVHAAIACPPITEPTCYGIDFPTLKELKAPGKTTEQIRRELGLESLNYLSNCSMYDAIKTKTGVGKEHLSNEMFTGNYWHRI